MRTTRKSTFDKFVREYARTHGKSVTAAREEILRVFNFTSSRLIPGWSKGTVDSLRIPGFGVFTRTLIPGGAVVGGLNGTTSSDRLRWTFRASEVLRKHPQYAGGEPIPVPAEAEG